jgi:hypothetical protein
VVGPANLGVQEHQPRIHQLDFGKGGDRLPTNEKTLIGIVEKNNVRGVIVGLFENFGDADAVLSIADSDDNDQTDKYGGELAVGTITFDGAANPSDTETVTLDDGVTGPIVFEFDVPDGITGDVAVTIGGTAADTLANLKAAIEGTALDVVVTDTTGAGDPQLTITRVTPSDSNITILEGAAAITVTGFAGGSAINDLTFRVAGAGVTSLSVTPRGKGEFQLEDVNALKRFLRFVVAAETSHIRLTLKYVSGRLVRRERPGVP